MALPDTDNFEKDPDHRAFKDWLEAKGRMKPRIDEPSQPPPKISSAPARITRKTVIELSSVPAPEIQEDGSGEVTVVMGIHRDVKLVYRVNQPTLVKVTVDGDVPDRMVAATRTLHISSVVLRDPSIGEDERRRARDLKLNSTLELAMNFGRPDLVQTNRRMFDGDLPGLPLRP